ncbi:hypothetical protein ACWGDT_20770 [Streptomyces avermitilis]
MEVPRQLKVAPDTAPTWRRRSLDHGLDGLSTSAPQMELLRNWEQRTHYMPYPELLKELEALAVQIVGAGTHTP